MKVESMPFHRSLKGHYTKSRMRPDEAEDLKSHEVDSGFLCGDRKMATQAAKWHLTITLGNDLRDFLEQATERAEQGLTAENYQGEIINFESAADFFSFFTKNKWKLINALQANGAGEPLAVRELARRLGRDVKRVHEDAKSLADYGLIEKTEGGAVICPFKQIHIDLLMKAHAQA